MQLFILLFMLAGLVLSVRPVSAREKPFTVYPEGRLDSVRVAWRQKEGAVKYKLYRADVSTLANNGSGDYPTRIDYKKIGTVKNKTVYHDKNIKKWRYYAYLVEAYDKKGKLIASTRADDSISYACKGLGRPVLGNGGYGENHTNTRKKLYLYIAADDYGAGYYTKNVQAVIYRKTAGGNKYKKLATGTLKDGFLEYADKKVKSGKKYSYKVQLIKKAGRKTYKSKKSKAVTIPAVNFSPAYKVRCLTPAGKWQDRGKQEITFTLANKSKYNGTMKILPSGGPEYDSATYFALNAKGETAEYPFRFTEYSKDGKVWKMIPAGGVKLPKKEILFLKGEILRGEEKDICFGGTTGKVSYISVEGGSMEYDGPGIGETFGTFDFRTGKGSAYLEWD